MSFEYYCSIPCGLSDGLIFPKKGCKSIQAMRCDDIEQQLAEHRLFANVSRHTLFGEKLYILSFNKDYGGGVHPDECNISRALQIPDEWVSLYDCDENKTEYAVKEKELNCKYKNDDGRLEWDNPFDFHKALSKYNTISLIKEQLGKSCKRVCVYLDDGLIFLECNLSSKIIAEKLGISEDSIVDISLTFEDMTHVIIIEEE